MIKLVLVAIVLVLLLPLFRRASGQGDGAKKKAKKDDAGGDAPPAPPADFSALMRTVVLLEGNDWSACTFDGAKEDWARFTAEPVRGFCTIPAGRHRASTRVGERDAVVDFVLRPGEIFARRLDRAAARWVELEGEALVQARREAEGGETGALGDALVRYRSTMGVARAMKGSVASPEKAYEDARRALEELLARGTDEASDLDARAAQIGETLVGVPLVRAQLDALVDVVRRAIDRTPARAATFARLGLAVLPGERTLLAHLDS